MKHDPWPTLLLTLGVVTVAVALVWIPLPLGSGSELRERLWLQDSSAALDATAVALLPAERFRPLDASVSAGFSSAPRWIRMRLQSHEAVPAGRALVFPYPLDTIEASGALVLQKPFTIAAVAEHVRAALTQSPASGTLRLAS